MIFTKQELEFINSNEEIINNCFNSKSNYNDLLHSAEEFGFDVNWRSKLFIILGYLAGHHFYIRKYSDIGDFALSSTELKDIGKVFLFYSGDLKDNLIKIGIPQEIVNSIIKDIGEPRYL